MQLFHLLSQDNQKTKTFGQPKDKDNWTTKRQRLLDNQKTKTIRQPKDKDKWTTKRQLDNRKVNVHCPHLIRCFGYPISLYNNMKSSSRIVNTSTDYCPTQKKKNSKTNPY